MTALRRWIHRLLLPPGAAATALPLLISLASAASPSLSGALLAAGLLSAPLIACGALKIAYDLTLFFSLRQAQRAATY